MSTPEKEQMYLKLLLLHGNVASLGLFYGANLKGRILKASKPQLTEGVEGVTTPLSFFIM